MLVRESAYKMDPIDKLSSQIPFIESVDSYPAAMVPIRRNDRFNKDLIQLEAFCAYAEAHNIEDAGEAIANVCEASNIKPTHIAFYVSEAACYIDENLLEVSKLLVENGYQVYLAPLSADTLEYRYLDEALELDEEFSDYESSPNMKAYCEGVVSDTVEKAKMAKSNTSEAVARKYTAAKQKLSELQQKVSRSSGEAKATLLRQIDKVKAGIEKLKARFSKKKEAEAE